MRVLKLDRRRATTSVSKCKEEEHWRRGIEVGDNRDAGVAASSMEMTATIFIEEEVARACKHACIKVL